EVKRRSADGSVGLPHVRVGNCQASNKWKASVERQGLFAMGKLGGFTKASRSHDGYSAWEGLVFLGSEAHFLPDIT
ncbi:hypothetical protein, partial [Pectobacterium polaris]|uniref:hypothetical protein n=1 Tax=Pectobacterium polaris TaxID=2042057 RepID=UPI002404A7D4